MHKTDLEHAKIGRKYPKGDFGVKNDKYKKWSTLPRD